MSNSDKRGFVEGIWLRVKRFLSSSELALALLVGILASCIAGVTILRGEEAWLKIFSTSWFNGLLVLLVVNVAFRFVGRIWGKKLTLISVGMLLFHLCFVSIFLGIVYNSMFGFFGKMRLTEGETLLNSDLIGYDQISHGRFYDMSQFKGYTTLISMHKGYKVEDQDKMVAYEVMVGEGANVTQDIIYITKSLVHDGYKFMRDKEGYSILVALYDKSGNYIYGGFIPLQSLMQEDGTYLYTTGTRVSPGSLPFPYFPSEPVFILNAAFSPSQFEERTGDVAFEVWPYSPDGTPHDQEALANGVVHLGEKFQAGDYQIALEEVRYWVGMDVRYDPGYPVILSSLWIGLAGLALTFIGRLRVRRTKKPAETSVA